MSEVLKSAPLVAVPKRVPNMVFVVGKVEAVRRYEGKFYTRVVSPAPDLYSQPSILEIRSKARLGAIDDELNIEARLGGYKRKAYRVTDKETGEQTNLIPVDMTLDAVE